MTYARSGQSIPIQLTAGQTLVVKELSGASSVTGGSALREAANFIGAGFVIYGPQSTAATVTLTTTGECDWYVVNGDPQRRAIASLSGDMDQSGNVSTLYTPSGAQLGGSGTYKLPKSRIALEKARARVKPFVIALLGDSNTIGEGAGTDTRGLTNGRARSVGAGLTEILNSRLFKTTSDAFFGDGNVSAFMNVYDPRLSALGTGWSWDGNGPHTLGGRFMIGQAGSSGPGITFAPSNAWNTAVLLLATTPGAASSVAVQAGATVIGTANTRLANGIQTYTFRTGAASAVQNLVIGAVSGDGNAYVAGWYLYDSANPGIVVCPAGWSGATIANLANTGAAWLYPFGAQALAPDLTILNCTINDSNQGAAAASYQASVAGLLSRVTSGDIIVAGGTPSNNVNTTNGKLDELMGVLQTLVGQYSTVDLIDWRTQFGPDYATAYAAGWMFDINHHNALGYQRQATVYANRLLNMITE